MNKKTNKIIIQARMREKYLLQVAETNTPRSMDVAGECLFYTEKE